MRPEPGAKIGDYEILGQLGAGGMGRVYKVRHELSDRLEAMKVLLPDLEGQADLANRFLREIKVQAGLDHPNIAKLYTASRIDNQLLMFMELVEGIGLDQRLRQGPIAVGDAVDYIVQVLNALDYAHQHGVIHRDIKPANMMLTANGRIKLLDFGIAKASAESRLTMTGTTLGSLYYMSPEQIQGGQVDARSDLYSVGVSLYELATGKRPFDDESQFAVMSAHIMREPVPPIQINRALPQEVSDEILRALSKDPATRFQTAGEFLDALSSVQSYAPPSMVPPPMTRPPVARAPGTRLPVPSLGDLPTAPIMLPPRAPEVPTRTMVQANVAEPAAAPLPPPVEPAKTGSRRLLWAGAGGIAAVLAIVGFIQFSPKRQPDVKGAAPVAPVTQPPVPTPAPKKRATGGGVAPGSIAKAKPAIEHPQAENTRPPAEQPPQATAAAPAPSAQPAAQPDNSVAGMVNQNRVDVAQLREAYDKLVQRAGAVRTSLQGGSHAELFDMFNALNKTLKEANGALNSGDPDKSRAALAKALEQLNLLETALAK